MSNFFVIFILGWIVISAAALIILGAVYLVFTRLPREISRISRERTHIFYQCVSCYTDRERYDIARGQRTDERRRVIVEEQTGLSMPHFEVSIFQM